jgi:broad specificity phosphatase PhoE
MTLVLVRHGESAANARGVFTGTLDEPLTDLGRVQAEAVARRFAGAPVAAVYASTLSRAIDTARPLAMAHLVDVTQVEDLCERCFGEAQGLAWSEIQARWKIAEYTDFHLVPGVERTEVMRERAWRATAEVLDRHTDSLAICFSHGGTIGQIIARLLGMPDGVRPGVRIANGSVTTIEGTSAAPVLVGMNDVCHLPSAVERAILDQ